MERERTLLQDGRRLTPELFDYYVAQARTERAKAIAEFGGTLVARLSGIVARLARHVRRTPRRDTTGTHAAR